MNQVGIFIDAKVPLNTVWLYLSYYISYVLCYITDINIVNVILIFTLKDAFQVSYQNG